MTIGGRQNTTTGIYYWEGLVTTAVPVPGDIESDWDPKSAQSEPVMSIRQYNGWDDDYIGRKRRLVCEKYYDQS